MLNHNCQDASTPYIQAYTTNKVLITHLEVGRHGLFMQGTDALCKNGNDSIPLTVKG